MNLVDTRRQFFKAEVGLGVRETPLETSFCGRAILSDDLMIVPDATKDPRFDCNPLVTGEPGLRFYAGALLKTPDGLSIGTICVLDFVPRELDEHQVRTLRLLARQAMTQLELRKALRERERANLDERRQLARSRRILDSATEYALVVTDREGMVTDWNKGAENVIGWTEAEMLGCPADRFFTSADVARGQVEAEMTGALRDGRAIDERWHVRKDGTRFWASGEMMPLVGEDGEHLGFVKMLRDRTHEHLAGERLRRTEARLTQAQEAGGVGVFTVEVATGFLEATPEFSRLYGLDHREHRPAQDFERLVVHEDQELVSHNSTRKAGASPKDVEYRIKRPDNGELRWISRKGEFERDANGTPVRFTGVAQDITARVRAEARLRESEAKWRGLFEQLQEGFILGRVLRDANGRIVDWVYEEVNHAWGELVGVPSKQAVGRTIREVFQGIEDDWVNEFAGVVETGETIRFTRQVGTIDRWYDGVAQPAGPDRFSVIFLEVTDRVRADARRKVMLELGTRLGDDPDPENLPDIVAEIIGRTLGVARVGYGSVSKDGRTLTVPRDWTAPGTSSLAGTYELDGFGSYAEDLRGGRTVVIDDVRTDPRTSNTAASLEALGVAALVNHPIVENGRLVAILYVNGASAQAWPAEDVSFVREAGDKTRSAIERRRAEVSLRRSEERRRMAIDAGSVGVWDLDLEAGTLDLDARMLEMNGVHSGSLDMQGAFDAIHPEDRERVERELKNLAMGAAETLAIRYRVVGVEDGKTRTIQVHGKATSEADGQVRHLIGAATDVTDRVAAEERRTVLNHELAHRLKNTLAVVQSIATQTLRTSVDLGSARKALGDRIRALSQAHDILLSGQRGAGSIGAVVKSCMAIHDDGKRLAIDGPDVVLGPKGAMSLVLVVHELATNAAKYGALTAPSGTVAISWSVEHEADTDIPVLAFDWREDGGPPVARPERSGFGSRLIQMGFSSAPGASVELSHDPSGLRCRIRAPLADLQRDEDVGE